MGALTLPWFTLTWRNHFKLPNQRTGCGVRGSQNKKGWAKEFPCFCFSNASPDLLPSPPCHGRSRSCPSAGLCRMGKVGENPILIPLRLYKEDQEIKEQATHSRRTRPRGRGTVRALSARSPRAVLPCGASADAECHSPRALTQGWQTAAAAELATFSHQRSPGLWIRQRIIAILSLLGNSFFKALSVRPHTVSRSVYLEG